MKTGIIAKISAKAIKQSPKLCLGGGLLCVVAGTIIACKKTYEKHDELVAAEEVRVVSKIHAENKKDIAISYYNYIKKILGIYYLPIGLTTSGVIIVIFGNRILNKRYLGLIAAYTSLDSSFKEYRHRVRDEYGIDKDMEFLTGSKMLGAPDNPDELKIAVDPDELFIPDRDITNGYFFMEGCEEWTKDPERNKEYLENMEEEANKIFNEQGYLFLNDVLAMVGIGPTSAGGEIGWCKGRGDNFVSFGIYEAVNRRSINGWEPVYILDFNHDGYILPYI